MADNNKVQNTQEQMLKAIDAVVSARLDQYDVTKSVIGVVVDDPVGYDIKVKIKEEVIECSLPEYLHSWIQKDDIVYVQDLYGDGHKMVVTGKRNQLQETPALVFEDGQTGKLTSGRDGIFKDEATIKEGYGTVVEGDGSTEILQPTTWNMLKNGNTSVVSSAYLVHTYDYSEIPQDGELVTITMRAKVDPGRDWVAIYNSGGAIALGERSVSKNDWDIYSWTIPWKSAYYLDGVSHYPEQTGLHVYAGPSKETMSDMSIDWIVMTRGNNTAEHWIPSSGEATVNTPANSTYILNELKAYIDQKVSELNTGSYTPGTTETTSTGQDKQLNEKLEQLQVQVNSLNTGKVNQYKIVRESNRTHYTIQHNLANYNIVVHLRSAKPPYEDVVASVERASANEIVVDLTYADVGKEIMVNVFNEQSRVQGYYYNITREAGVPKHTIRHNLGTHNVIVYARRDTSPYNDIMVGVERVSLDEIILDLTYALIGEQFTVCILRIPEKAAS